LDVLQGTLGLIVLKNLESMRPAARLWHCAAPLTGETWVDGLARPDHPVAASQQPVVNVRWINSDYLSIIQSPLIAGRNLTAVDRVDSHVALISQRTAREAFPGENSLGRKSADLVPDDKHMVTVIGAVSDARVNGLKDNRRWSIFLAGPSLLSHCRFWCAARSRATH
jgi:hypothetical protein